MQLSNEKIVSLFSVLTSLKGVKLPIKVSFAVKKNILKMEKVVAAFYEEHNNMIERYCERDENNKIKVQDGVYIIKNKEEWNRDIKDLLEIENEVDLHLIELTDLLNSNIELTTQELNSLEVILKE
ncbi:hypothetical protein [Clostridium paraputrificum]|uniref:hypothetical protein n=2 Tax=Clostridium TaxID=1485 RepID=UPI00374E587F